MSSLLAVPLVYLSLACQHVIHKTCWAAVQLLRASSDNLDDTTLGLCSALIKLFILIPQDDSGSMGKWRTPQRMTITLHLTSPVKDLIVEALSSMSVATLRHVMKDICDDVKLNLPMRLDESKKFRATLSKTDVNGLHQNCRALIGNITSSQGSHTRTFLFHFPGGLLIMAHAIRVHKKSSMRSDSYFNSSPS